MPLFYGGWTVPIRRLYIPIEITSCKVNCMICLFGRHTFVCLFSVKQEARFYSKKTTLKKWEEIRATIRKLQETVVQIMLRFASETRQFDVFVLDGK